MQYLNINEPYADFGILKYINKSTFNHCCNTLPGSSGSPILNLVNNKVIGIHTGGIYNHNYNIGSFLNNAINDFIKKYNNIIEENEIKCVINKSTKIMHFEDSGINMNDDYNENENINTTSENDLSIDNLMYKEKFVDKEDILCLHNIVKNIKVLNLTYNNLSDIKILQKIDYENQKNYI